jgi:hypothetical protein
VIQGENHGRFEGVELNKTFRWEPVGKNYIIEPLFGVRYMKVLDRPGPIRRTVEFDAAGPTGNEATEGSEMEVENNILGGQMGVRIHRQTERWITAVESKLMPGINWQFYPTQDYSEFTVYGQVRASATYKLTRDISIGTGFDIMQFGMGIARGGQRGVGLAGFPGVFPPEDPGDPNDPNDDTFTQPKLVNLPRNDQDMFIGGFSIMFTINR